jgi:hypothetical protein
MSRTYKDKPWKHDKDYRYSRYSDTFDKVPYVAQYRDYYTNELVEYTRFIFMQIAGALPKCKRNHVEKHHMPTPNWWVHMIMTRPQRRAGRMWERKIHFEDLEEIDPPGVGRKPHIYYW